MRASTNLQCSRTLRGTVLISAKNNRLKHGVSNTESSSQSTSYGCSPYGLFLMEDFI